jgi:AraC-like DNA-binding protein
MDKLLQLMEQQIGNGELTVDMLVKNFYMSRSSFFAKLKTLTGLSPIEFIQQMRVKRAAQLIEEDQYSMSEIATMVGINDPHYFSRYFKKAYSMTPTEYKKKVLSQK